MKTHASFGSSILNLLLLHLLDMLLLHLEHDLEHVSDSQHRLIGSVSGLDSIELVLASWLTVDKTKSAGIRRISSDEGYSRDWEVV